MFHIFSKKKFLVDYLQNFVDIHNHILPGIDDGAKNTRESIALIRGFKEIIEFAMANGVLFSAKLTQKNIKPLRVEFKHPKPDDCSLYDEIFSCEFAMNISLLDLPEVTVDADDS